MLRLSSLLLLGCILLRGATAGAGTLAPGLADEARARGRVPVIVELALATRAEGRLPSPGAVAAQRAAIAALGDRLAPTLAGTAHARWRAFRTVPFVALEAGPRALARLAAAGEVRSVVRDALAAPSLDESVPLIGAAPADLGGLDGSPYAVAVLDTGVDASHPAFGGRIGDEACFSAEGDCPDGSAAQVGAGAARPCDYAPSCFHGTHVAGIVASGNATWRGVAPGALLLPAQVFSAFSGAPCAGTGEDPCALSYVSDQIAALEWVLDLAATRPIAAVNLSLAVGRYTSQAACDSAEAALGAVIENLRSRGIATVAAAGNDGWSGALPAPACLSPAVSVGATTKSDVLASFSNRAPFLSLLAPGVDITSAVPYDLLGFRWGAASGTSAAAPHVAGAFALLRQAHPEASVAAILAALRATGVAIAGADAPRVSVDGALATLDAPDCSDGIDDDGDGLVDFGQDPGCRSASAAREDPACDDGRDDDGDGKIDYPADPDCTAAWDGSEAAAACGVGAELALALPPLFAWRARRRRRRVPDTLGAC